MTKARDLSNIISGGFTADDIPNLDASKITTGQLANDRISQSSVSQHATSFDDNKIVNDISTLALRQASDQDKSAYNTNSQFVDVFQDDTGIDTITNVNRNANEYVSSTSQSTTNYGATTNLFNTSPFTDNASYASSSGTASGLFDADGITSSGGGGIGGYPGFPQYAQIDFGSGNAYVINKYSIYANHDFNGPYFGSHTVQGSNDGSNFTTLRSHSGANGLSSGGYFSYTFTNTTAYRYYKCTVTDNAGGYANEISWHEQETDYVSNIVYYRKLYNNNCTIKCI
jgi:hypothetical protein